MITSRRRKTGRDLPKENFLALSETLQQPKWANPFLEQSAPERLSEDLTDLKEEGVFIVKVPGKGLGLMAGPHGVGPGNIGVMWGAVEMVEKTKNKTQAVVNNRSIQKLFNLFSGGTEYTCVLHAARACALSFLNAPSPGEHPNVILEDTSKSRWLSAMSPLSVPVKAIEGAALNDNELLQTLTEDCAGVMATLEVRVTEFVLPGSELLLSYPWNDSESGNRPDFEGDFTSSEEVFDFISREGLLCPPKEEYALLLEHRASYPEENSNSEGDDDDDEKTGSGDEGGSAGSGTEEGSHGEEDASEYEDRDEEKDMAQAQVLEEESEAEEDSEAQDEAD